MPDRDKDDEWFLPNILQGASKKASGRTRGVGILILKALSFLAGAAFVYYYVIARRI